MSHTRVTHVIGTRRVDCQLPGCAATLFSHDLQTTSTIAPNILYNVFSFKHNIHDGRAASGRAPGYTTLAPVACEELHIHIRRVLHTLGSHRQRVASGQDMDLHASHIYRLLCPPPAVAEDRTFASVPVHTNRCLPIRCCQLQPSRAPHVGPCCASFLLFCVCLLTGPSLSGCAGARLCSTDLAELVLNMPQAFV